MKNTQITDVEAFACSVPLTAPVNMGLGQAVKREAVVVKVTTADGVIGYGEAHHIRGPAAMAALLNTTIRDLVLGMDALETVAVWERVYRNQLASHGAGTTAACALSGLDMALWDIRGKVFGLPLYRLLGGQQRAIPAYAGGIGLGYQPPDKLVDEVAECRAAGFRAVKLRIGDEASLDVARIRAVREAHGDELEIFTDANTRYSLDDARRVLPALRELNVGWLEEPFPPHAEDAYARVARWTDVPLAAGENHYLRFEFQRLINAGAVTVLQPDVSKSGGITEVMRIAALAATAHLTVNPHTSVTGLNMAAVIHVIASLPNAHFFEADIAKGNQLHDVLCSTPYVLDPAGTVTPLDGPGIGVEVDEDFLRAHPLTPGAAFVPWN
ncbi:MAG TPA: mandelate racemase/muconate lactonizing enzyme family protein [Cellulomonas sp.]